MRSNCWASLEGTGPPQKAWSVSKLTSLIQDLSSRRISKTLSKNASCLGRIVGHTIAEMKQKGYIIKKKCVNQQPIQSWKLTRFVQKPPWVVIKRPYSIPLIGTTHLIDPLHTKKPSFPLTIKIWNVKYQSQGWWMTHKIIKTLRLRDRLRFITIKELV